MRLTRTTDPRLSLSPTIQDMAGHLLPEFISRHYTEDREVHVLHERDLSLRTVPHSPAYRTLNALFQPVALGAALTASMMEDYLMARPFARMFQNVMMSPLSEMLRESHEEELRGKYRKAVQRSTGVVLSDTTPYVVLIADADRASETELLSIPRGQVKPDKLGGDARSWQMVTLGHEIGHVVLGIPDKRDRFHRIAEEGNADHIGAQFYAQACDVDPSMDRTLPDQFQMLRRADLIKEHPMRLHFPGGTEVAALARHPDRDQIFGAYDMISESWLAEIKSYSPYRVYADLKSMERYGSKDIWAQHWVQECKRGWEEMHERGIVNIERRPDRTNRNPVTPSVASPELHGETGMVTQPFQHPPTQQAPAGHAPQMRMEI